MGKNSSRPAGEHSREEGGFRGRADVPDRVDPSMNPMEAAGATASGNGPSVHPYAFELFQADQTVLPVGDRRDLQVPVPRSKPKGRFVRYGSTKGRFVQATWTFRPVGGGRQRCAHGASEAAG